MTPYIHAILPPLPFLIWAAYSDAKRGEVSNLCSIALFGGGILTLFYKRNSDPSIFYANLLFAGMLALILFIVWNFSKGEVGGGDVKVFVSLSLFIGAKYFVPLFILANIAALLYALLFKRKSVRMMPFTLFAAALLGLYSM